MPLQGCPNSLLTVACACVIHSQALSPSLERDRRAAVQLSRPMTVPEPSVTKPPPRPLPSRQRSAVSSSPPPAPGRPSPPAPPGLPVVGALRDKSRLHHARHRSKQGGVPSKGAELAQDVRIPGPTAPRLPPITHGSPPPRYQQPLSTGMTTVGGVQIFSFQSVQNDLMRVQNELLRMQNNFTTITGSRADWSAPRPLAPRLTSHADLIRTMQQCKDRFCRDRLNSVGRPPPGPNAPPNSPVSSLPGCFNNGMLI